MYGREQRVLLRHYLERGLSKAEVARELGVSRRTVYHWIESGQLERELDEAPLRYAPRPPVARKIDAFRGIIDARLSEFPRLTATRLLEEIRAAGYAGGYTQLKDYVRGARPAQPPEPIVRFETPPGHQAQVDFAEFHLPWGKRYALLVVLGYSRLLWLQFCSRQTMAVLMCGLEDAFAFFGGVPAELLFDQMKAVIIDDDRARGGRLLENPEFVRFAAHCGFRIRACRRIARRPRVRSSGPSATCGRASSMAAAFSTTPTSMRRRCRGQRTLPICACIGPRTSGHRCASIATSASFCDHCRCGAIGRWS
jgi:transposase